jgi:hypothetical protein
MIVTEEQIQQGLNKARITLENNCLYELTDSGFGKSVNIPNFRKKIEIHRIEGENRVSYLCGKRTNINTKKLTFTDSYTGCLRRTVRASELIDAIWLECNKYTIIGKLKSSRNVQLYKSIVQRLEEVDT